MLEYSFKSLIFIGKPPSMELNVQFCTIFVLYF
uniref:Uncharacterized protein n=1 Tax=Anguilla anguilla TaxID=7936 RepID=A0A0E9SPQ8_ANGAN